MASETPASLSTFQQLLGNTGHSSHQSKETDNNSPDYAFNVMAATILNGREDHPCEPSLQDALRLDDICASLIQEAVRLSLCSSNTILVLHDIRL